MMPEELRRRGMEQRQRELAGGKRTCGWKANLRVESELAGGKQTCFARRRLCPRGEEACIGAQTCTNAEKKPIFGEAHVRSPCHVAAKAIKGRKFPAPHRGRCAREGEGALCPVLLRACMDASRAFAPAHTRAGEARRRTQSAGGAQASEASRGEASALPARAARARSARAQASEATRARDACVLHGPRLPSLTHALAGHAAATPKSGGGGGNRAGSGDSAAAVPRQPCPRRRSPR
jgi:hypothetical protein